MLHSHYAALPHLHRLCPRSLLRFAYFAVRFFFLFFCLCGLRRVGNCNWNLALKRVNDLLFSHSLTLLSHSLPSFACIFLLQLPLFGKSCFGVYFVVSLPVCWCGSWLCCRVMATQTHTHTHTQARSLSLSRLRMYVWLTAPFSNVLSPYAAVTSRLWVCFESGQRIRIRIRPLLWLLFCCSQIEQYCRCGLSCN